jgi:O-antigen ligase/thioredoxin-like negative regulator of GroEL
VIQPIFPKPTSAQHWEDLEEMKLNPRLLTPTAGLVCSSALCFFLTAVAGVWAAYDTVAALQRFGLIVLGLALMSGVAWAGRRHAKTVLSAIGLACSVVAAGLSVAYVLGLVENSGIVASALMVLLPLAMAGLYWHRVQRMQRSTLIGVAAIALACIGFIATRERTAWLGLGAGVLAAGYLYWRSNGEASRRLQRVLDVLIATGVVVGLFVYWVVLLNPAFDEIVAAAPLISAISERIPLWRDSIALVRDYRYTGSGLGGSAMIYSTYQYLLHVPYFYHAHQLYMQMAMEQGLPGLIAFLWMIIPLTATLVTSLPARGPYSRYFCLATLAALVALMVYGLLDAELYATPLVFILFLPPGFSLALHWALQYRGQAHSRPQPDFPFAGTTKVNLAGVMGLLPLLTIGALLLWPGSLANMHANLGALAQSKAELGKYRWPAWPIQDELRRSAAVDLSPAIEQYKAALALDPDNATAHERLGQIALARGNYSSAEKHLAAAYAVAPQRSAVRLLLGEVYAVTGHVEKAVVLWRTVDIAGDQLHNRLWWYNALKATKEADWLRQVLGRRE